MRGRAPRPRAGARRRWRLPATTPLWVYVSIVAAVAALTGWLVTDLEPLYDGLHIPWWALTGLFYAAERAVVHMRFRRDAHSFSLSDIPLVLGMFFSSPMEIVLAQLAANTIVLVFHRRLPAVKVAFNLAQFALQTVAAVTVFRTVVGTTETFGPRSWLAAAFGVLVALAIADILINIAIRLSGGRLDVRQMLEIFWLSGIAALMNTSLALTAVLVLSASPDAAWLALAPPVALFVAYRAYVAQRQEGTRLQSLYEASRVLHSSPQIEAALVASADQATAMLDGEFAEVLLFNERAGERALLTAVGPGTRREVMTPVDVDVTIGIWGDVRAAARGLLVHDPALLGLSRPYAVAAVARDAVLVPLWGPDEVIGALLVANRLGDISTFSDEDLELLDALGRQVGVSLENGRLEDSLAQLRELKEQLEELVRSKDQFVATVSHELRTPLTAIMGLSQELRSSRETFSAAEFDEMVALIAEQSDDLSSMIEDLLVAARADIGTVRLSIGPVSVAAEIEAVLDGRATYRERPAPDVRIAGDERVLADALRLRQILRNLLSNAERYGGERVAVEVRAAASMVEISVLDDGLGVPAGREEVIFEPYASAHDPGSQPASVGLGLAVSRKLAELMGGRLEYRRRSGWTEFTLALPGVSVPEIRPDPAGLTLA